MSLIQKYSRSAVDIPTIMVAVIFAFAIGSVALLLGTQPAFATEGACAIADSVDSFTPGPESVGDPVSAVAAFDGNEISLGKGGEIVVEFPASITVIDGPGPDFLIGEGGAADTAEVLVSINGVDFVSLGNFARPADKGQIEVDISGSGLPAIAFVKIIDDGDEDGSGFDLDAVEAYYCDISTPETDGRFTGGGHQIQVDGVRVTKGLTIHCDLLLSNNLEINWNGNQFHMTEHLTTVECSDDPAIIQAPPPAPLDTLIGIGDGRYNGVDGYTVEFTLRDFGEPGTDDQAGFLIYETANPANIVLNVPLQVVSGGNLQAHYDQPHK